MNHKLLIIVFILFNNIGEALAQSCQQKLEDAEGAWHNGKFKEVETLLTATTNP